MNETRRQFIKKVVLGLASLSPFAILASYRRAQAITYLDQLKPLTVNEIQQNLLNNSKKEILLVEDGICASIPFGTPQKAKCKGL